MHSYSFVLGLLVIVWCAVFVTAETSSATLAWNLSAVSNSETDSKYYLRNVFGSARGELFDNSWQHIFLKSSIKHMNILLIFGYIKLLFNTVIAGRVHAILGPSGIYTNNKNSFLGMELFLFYHCYWLLITLVAILIIPILYFVHFMNSLYYIQ